MAQFFQNVWEWFCTQGSAIADWLTPANFLLLVANVVAILRTVKTVKANTGITYDLGTVLKDTKILQTIKDNANEIAELKEQNDDLRDLMTQSITKLNAVLNVQENAYNASNLPKETRVAINNFIAAGKFAESKTHVAVADEITALKAQIQRLAEEGNKTEERIKKLTNTAETTAVITEKPKVEGVRYD